MTTLNQYADALLRNTGFESAPDQVHITRVVSPVLNIMSTQAVADIEPFDISLPLNVVWLCMDRSTPFYKVLLVRESSVPSQGFQNTWTPIKALSQVWAPQYYDTDASASDGQAIENATTLTQGIARLTVAPQADAYPKFVSVSDPRRTDARYPNKHTHPERPAVRLKHIAGSINVDAAQPLLGQTLRALNAGESAYAKVTALDVKEAF